MKKCVKIILISSLLMNSIMAAENTASREEYYGYALQFEAKEKYHHAFKFYKLSADQGHAGAQCNFGVYCAKGLTDKEDPASAVKYFQLAADQNCALSQFNLGLCYYEGTGVEKDHGLAFKYFQLATDQGIKGCHYKFGLILEQKEKHKEALSQFKKALDQGCLDALVPLGRLSYKLNDSLSAHEYFEKAVKYNIKDAVIYYVDFLLFCQLQEEAEQYIYFYEEIEMEGSEKVSLDDSKKNEDAPASKTTQNESITSKSENVLPVVKLADLEKKISKYLEQSKKQERIQIFKFNHKIERSKTYEDIQVSVVYKVEKDLLGVHKIKIQSLLSVLANGEKRGRFEKLKGYPDVFSMRLTKSDRLIFTITKGDFTTGIRGVHVLAVVGHYDTLSKDLMNKKKKDLARCLVPECDGLD